MTRALPAHLRMRRQQPVPSRFSPTVCHCHTMMQVGVVHGPVETQFGSHLILITRRYVPQTTPHGAPPPQPHDRPAATVVSSVPSRIKLTPRPSLLAPLAMR